MFSRSHAQATDKTQFSIKIEQRSFYQTLHGQILRAHGELLQVIITFRVSRVQEVRHVDGVQGYYRLIRTQTKFIRDANDGVRNALSTHAALCSRNVHTWVDMSVSVPVHVSVSMCVCVGVMDLRFGGLVCWCSCDNDERDVRHHHSPMRSVPMVPKRKNATAWAQQFHGPNRKWQCLHGQR